LEIKEEITTKTYNATGIPIQKNRPNKVKARFRVSSKPYKFQFFTILKKPTSEQIPITANNINPKKAMSRPAVNPSPCRAKITYKMKRL
jgi:hypothetical protein